MPFKINNIKTDLNTNIEELKMLALKKLSLKESDLLEFKVLRRSLDARKKQVCFVYSVSLSLKDENKVIADGVNVIKLKNEEKHTTVLGTEKLKTRPVIVGSGPAGLFCGLTLAKYGYKPIIFERGADVDKRTDIVNTYFSGGDFSKNTNIQFGEGGAGTFSDGKLTTRINDPLSGTVLRDFVRFGADSSILINAKPHIGTDILKIVVKNMRNEIIRLGGEVRFNSCVTDFIIKNDKLCGIMLDGGEKIETDILVLAIGHSARDTYKKLFDLGVNMEQKAFSVGARIEHLQSFIDEAMYGSYAGHPALGSADYSLSYRDGDVGCYSFCMCPGGTVVSANSEENSVVTNGMSVFARDGINANSAICVSVNSNDFKSTHPLAGVEFQRELEKRAFLFGGNNYSAPIQRVSDFLENKLSTSFGKVKPTYPLGTKFCNLNEFFPDNISKMLSDGLRFFDRKIKGFAKNDAIITAPETRTSAPLRIIRNEQGESTNVSGLYPSGEGAGYAGGIMSAAVDGIKTAEKIMSRFSPFEN